MRKATGINFSNTVTNNEPQKSDLKFKIEAFDKENTIEVPDKRKFIKGIRYRTASKLCLFEGFDSRYPNLCTYATFCKYWPRKYLKPKPSDLGTCMCIICQNTELKMEAVKRVFENGANHCLEAIIENSKNGNFEAENDYKNYLEELIEDQNKTVLGYLRWEKIKQTEININTGRPKSDKVMRSSKTETADNLAKSLLE